MRIHMFKIIPLMVTLLGFTIFSSAQAPASRKSSSNCEVQELAIEAALGDKTAQYNLAVAFFTGERVPRDYSKSAVLWRLAVKDGNLGAHNNLGYLMYYGQGTKQDYAEGVRLWRVAAERGMPESQIHLGFAYYDERFLK